MNFQNLKTLPNSDLIISLPKFTSGEAVGVCPACQFGKQARQPFKESGRRVTKLLELVYPDVWTSSLPK